MREIKFKIWDKENKKFTDDDIYMDKNGNLGRVQDDGFYCEDTFIPLRFTGLLDKKGKEIYEGDIVRRWIWLNRETRIRLTYTTQKISVGQDWIILWCDECRATRTKRIDEK